MVVEPRVLGIDSTKINTFEYMLDPQTLKDASRIRLALRVQTESAIRDFKCAAYYAHVFCTDRFLPPTFSGRYAPRTTHLFYVSFAREALSGRYAHGVLRTRLTQWDRKSGLGGPMTDALRTCTTLSTVNGGGEGIMPHVLRTRLMHRSPWVSGGSLRPTYYAHARRI